MMMNKSNFNSLISLKETLSIMVLPSKKEILKFAVVEAEFSHWLEDLLINHLDSISADEIDQKVSNADFKLLFDLILKKNRFSNQKKERIIKKIRRFVFSRFANDLFEENFRNSSQFSSDEN